MDGCTEIFERHYSKGTCGANNSLNRQRAEAADRVGAEVMDTIMAEKMEQQGWVFRRWTVCYVLQITEKYSKAMC